MKTKYIYFSRFAQRAGTGGTACTNAVGKGTAGDNVLQRALMVI